MKNVLKLSILPIESVFIIEFDVKLKVKIADQWTELGCSAYISWIWINRSKRIETFSYKLGSNSVLATTRTFRLG